MPTFILNKYEDKEQKPTEQEDTVPEKNEGAVSLVRIDGTLAEIIARSLNTALKNKGVEMIRAEKEEDLQNAITIKSVSSEEIKKDPLTSYRKISKDDIVFINIPRVSCAEESWFVDNVNIKVGRHFHTLESLVDHVAYNISKGYL